MRGIQAPRGATKDELLAAAAGVFGQGIYGTEQPSLGLLPPLPWEQAFSGLEALPLAERVAECVTRLNRLTREWRANGPLLATDERFRAWRALLHYYEAADDQLRVQLEAAAVEAPHAVS